MILNEQQQKELLEVSKPLIKWINENCNLHCRADVTQNSVELLEAIEGHITNEFVK